MLLPLGVFVVIFYFLIIRPQKKRQRKHEEMLASIRSFIVEIADGVKARILKASIQMKKHEGEAVEPSVSENLAG
jgi:preprotein translocase subunit YajC